MTIEERYAGLVDSLRWVCQSTQQGLIYKGAKTLHDGHPLVNVQLDLGRGPLLESRIVGMVAPNLRAIVRPGQPNAWWAYKDSLDLLKRRLVDGVLVCYDHSTEPGAVADCAGIRNKNHCRRLGCVRHPQRRFNVCRFHGINTKVPGWGEINYLLNSGNLIALMTNGVLTLRDFITADAPPRYLGGKPPYRIQA